MSIVIDNIKRFENELGKVQRDGIDELLGFIKNKTDMYTAPASGKYHLSVPGGLLQHSLNVLDALRGLLSLNPDGTYSFLVAGKSVCDISEENVIVMALLHDICKVNFYEKTTRNRKNENGQWESYPFYEINDTSPLGHGEKSVIMLMEFIKLKKEELYAIRWHMGAPEGEEKYAFNAAVSEHPMIWALHSADMMASQYMEDKESNNILYQ